MDGAGKLKLAVGALVVLGLGAGAGMLAQDQMDARLAKATAESIRTDRQRERDAAALREAHLNEIIETERLHHADALRQRDTHLAAFTARTGRMRNELETMLDDSRRSGDACIARAAGIAEAVGALLDAVGEGAGLLEEAQRENQRLAEANRKLASQVAGWQQRYAERTQRITVTAKKPAG
jgi:lambda repressor-like predicted transcriptional regulator